MTDKPFSLVFIEDLLERCLQTGIWEEQGDPCMALTSAEDEAVSAGYLRYWKADQASPLDRMLHMRLIAGPVETQLMFLFGKPGTSMPHFHAQAVQFPPEGCVYNVDFLPRVDPIDHPEWFEDVFGSLRRPYRKATADKDNSCNQAPANPALALYMSPYGIASAQTTREELEKVSPCIDAYLDHYLELATRNDWDKLDTEMLKKRDSLHLAKFFADEMDPRAWNGVYRIIGEDAGHKLKALIQNPA
ncbi:MAG: hypothetical protein ACR2QG_05520 [Gammaproteobacteria bacterium]